MQHSRSGWAAQTTNNQALHRAGGRRRHNAQRQAVAYQCRRLLSAAHMRGDMPVWVHGAQVIAIRDELQAVGSGLPADVQLYPIGRGLVIGDIEVKGQRLQTNVSRLAKDVLRARINRGEISLDKPHD